MAVFCVFGVRGVVLGDVGSEVGIRVFLEVLVLGERGLGPAFPLEIFFDVKFSF